MRLALGLRGTCSRGKPGSAVASRTCTAAVALATARCPTSGDFGFDGNAPAGRATHPRTPEGNRKEAAKRVEVANATCAADDRRNPRRVFRTASRSNAEPLMTLSTSAVAVCWVSNSSRSRVPASSSPNSRAFRPIRDRRVSRRSGPARSLSVKGQPRRGPSERTPIGVPPCSIGTPQSDDRNRCRFGPGGEYVVGIGFDVPDVDGFPSRRTRPLFVAAFGNDGQLSNIFSFTAAGMPVPLSRIRISMLWPRFLVAALSTGSKSLAGLGLAPGGGVEAVGDQVEEHAGDFLRKHHDLAGRGIEVAPQGDVKAGLLGAGAVIGEVEALLHQRVDVGGPVLAGALARMQQHVLDDGIGAACRAAPPCRGCTSACGVSSSTSPRIMPVERGGLSASASRRSARSTAPRNC